MCDNQTHAMHMCSSITCALLTSERKCLLVQMQYQNLMDTGSATLRSVPQLLHTKCLNQIVKLHPALLNATHSMNYINFQ